MRILFLSLWYPYPTNNGSKIRIFNLLRGLAENLARQSVTIEANANDEGHLYGSVGAPEIVSALKRNEVTITADQVRLKGPLKELGLYTVQIHLGHDIEAELKVWVVPTVSEEPTK